MSDQRKFESELEREGWDALERILAEVRDSYERMTVPGGYRAQPDFLVRLSRGQLFLACEVRSRAWPNELPAVAHLLREFSAGFSEGEVVPVLIAPSVSERAAQVCQTLGLSWVDFAGNCSLRIGGSFIRFQGRAGSGGRRRESGSLFSPKASRVLHALLLHPGRLWKTQELSDETGVSLGQVAAVKQRLERDLLLRSSYGQTELIEPDTLLDLWSAGYAPKRRVFRYFSLESPEALEARVSESLREAALTEFSAAERYAPYTRHQRVSFVAPGWSDALAKTLDLRAGDGASNVTVYSGEEPVLFSEIQRGVRCVSPVQCYLDLMLLAGRGQDAARHLRETVFRARWA